MNVYCSALYINAFSRLHSSTSGRIRWRQLYFKILRLTSILVEIRLEGFQKLFLHFYIQWVWSINLPTRNVWNKVKLTQQWKEFITVPLLAYFYYFEKNKRMLMKSPCCLSLHLFVFPLIFDKRLMRSPFLYLYVRTSVYPAFNFFILYAVRVISKESMD
jgi:hypothetical protein